MSLKNAIVSQFSRPRGWAGSLAGWIMAGRESNRTRNEWAVGLLDLPPGATILEVGCGPGLGIQALAARFPDANLIANDHSDLMLQMTARRNRSLIDVGCLEILPGDIQRVELMSGSLNGVYSSNVVQFWEDPRKLFRKFHDWLKPDGYLIINYMARNSGATSRDTEQFVRRLQEMAIETGFRHIQVEFLPLKPVSSGCLIARK